MATKTKTTRAPFYEIIFPGAENVRLLCSACSELMCIRLPATPQWRADNQRGPCHFCGANRKEG